MANIYVNECSDSADGQKWNVMADGRIAVDASSPRKQHPDHLIGDSMFSGLALIPSRAMRGPSVYEGNSKQPGRLVRLCRVGQHWREGQGYQLAT